MLAACDKHKLLETLPPFRACSARELRLAVRLAEVIRVGCGAVLVQEGRPGHEFFAIAQGTAKVERAGRTLAMLGPGDHFGELAILAQAPRDATVTSTSPMELVVIEERVFRGLMSESPAFRRRVVEAMARRLHQADVRSGAAAQPS